MRVMYIGSASWRGALQVQRSSAGCKAEKYPVLRRGADAESGCYIEIPDTCTKRLALKRQEHTWTPFGLLCSRRFTATLLHAGHTIVERACKSRMQNL